MGSKNRVCLAGGPVNNGALTEVFAGGLGQREYQNGELRHFSKLLRICVVEGEEHGRT
jgi:hypothetical protein